MSKSIHMPSVRVFGNCLATLLGFPYLLVLSLFSLSTFKKGFEVIFNKILYTLNGKMETARGDSLKHFFLSYGCPQASCFLGLPFFPSDKIAEVGLPIP